MGGVGHCQPYLVFVLWGRSNDCKILNDFLCVLSFTSTRLTTEGGRGGEGGREERREGGRKGGRKSEREGGRGRKEEGGREGKQLYIYNMYM